MSIFAVVDVETTGGSLKQGSRITEVAVVIHNGTSVEETFSSLINPEIPIPEFISKLTGITDEMVADAPKFSEVATHILKLTEGKIFVAHNAAFDYGHFLHEFERCGLTFSSYRICTCILSRKIFPGFGSYSLNILAQNLGIPFNGHHRALNDALATGHVLAKLVHKAGLETIQLYRTPPEIDYTLPVHLIEKLPEAPGVYYFSDHQHNLLYIGKSKNIKKRVASHFKKNNTKARKIKSMIHDISYMETGCELLACLWELNEIKRYQPFFNRAGKKEKQFGIFKGVRKDGLPFLKTDSTENISEQPLLTFASNAAAKTTVEQITKDFQLCSCINGLETYRQSCLFSQIGYCNGVLQGRESHEKYWVRFNQAISKFTLKTNNAGLFYKTNFESSGVYIVRYEEKIGFGFAHQQLTCFHDIESRLTYLDSHDELHSIFNSFYKRHKNAQINFNI